MRIPLVWTVVATLLLAGCAMPKMNTPSGANEVTIAAPLARVKTELARVMVGRGYTLKQSDDLVLVAERDAGTVAAVLFGTGANPYAQLRARVNFLTDGDAVRVVLHGVLVDGNGYESPVKPSPKTQAWLEQLKQTCEAK